MSDLIDRARMLAQAATPGPWCYGPDSGYVALAYRKDNQWFDLLDLLLDKERAMNNGKFIAASRELVPALCDALEQARAEIAQLRALEVKP